VVLPVPKHKRLKINKYQNGYDRSVALRTTSHPP